ncbi:hypothetical protein, partial [Peribacillus frigoritolerans]|uniref:hypothetical protein n=1 Tax=Peribacillus frigoritolerans TaxID=450367 RepID=UPI00203EFD25
MEINVYKRKGADLFNQLNFLNEKLQANLNCPVNVRHQTNIYGVFFMANFSAEQKIFIVRLYLEGKHSYM